MKMQIVWSVYAAPPKGTHIDSGEIVIGMFSFNAPANVTLEELKKRTFTFWVSGRSIQMAFPTIEGEEMELKEDQD